MALLSKIVNTPLISQLFQLEFNLSRLQCPAKNKSKGKSFTLKFKKTNKEEGKTFTAKIICTKAKNILVPAIPK